MSSKNFMAYGDAETVLTGFANEIKDNDRKVYSAMAFNGVKNLAKLQYDNGYNTSIGSITHTYNNGEVTLSAGTASAQSYSFPAISTEGFELEADRSYVLTGIPSNAPEGVSLRMRYYNGSTNVAIATDEGEGATFSFTAAMKSSSNYHLMINIAPGTVIPAGGIVIRPMVRYAEDKGTTFEKHVSNNRELEASIAALSEKLSYLETTATLSTSATTTVTFTDSRLTTSSCVEVGVSEWGLVPDDVAVTTGSCTVTFPSVDSAHTVTVRLYLR